MLRHGGWTTLPASEADTDTEARRTPARHGVGSLSIDQTRPALRHAPADTSGCSDARLIRDSDNFFAYVSENGSRFVLFTFCPFLLMSFEYFI